MWICSLCQLPVAKNHNFGQILTLGAPVPTPFYQWGSNLMLEKAQGLHLHPNFIWMRSLCRLPVAKKTTILGNFDFFGGLLYRPPFTDEGQIWTSIVDSRCTLTCQISYRSVYSVALRWQKNPIFAIFIGVRHLVLSPIRSSLRKMNTGAQLQSFPYLTASKSFLYCNAFMAKSGAQSLTYKTPQLHNPLNKSKE